MNPMEYLESVRKLLLTDFRITGHQIVREFEELEKAYIRARLTLSDDSFLEFSEYIEQVSEDKIQITDYSYHWIDKDGKFLRRWDNTKHFPKLQNAPDHIHTPIGEAEEEVTPGKPTNIFEVLNRDYQNHQRVIALCLPLSVNTLSRQENSTRSGATITDLLWRVVTPPIMPCTMIWKKKMPLK